MMCEVVDYIKCPKYGIEIPRTICERCDLYDIDDGRGYYIYCKYEDGLGIV